MESVSASPASFTTPTVQAQNPDIGALIAELERLKERRTIQLAYEMGRLVAQRLYGADPSAFRERGQNCPVYRQLVTDPRLTVSPVTIWRSLGVYELCRRMPELLQCERLRLGHLYAVLGLTFAAQERLLTLATKGGLSVSDLSQRASGTPKRSAAGRPRQTALDRAVSPLRSFVELAKAVPFVAPIRASKRTETLELLRETRNLCESLSTALGETPSTLSGPTCSHSTVTGAGHLQTGSEQPNLSPG